MAFVNLSLLLGGAFVAIPVVLHLIMRQKPKQLVFPAVRFIQQRRLANQRRLQLRHWILLALRCGAVGLLAVALARPSVASAALSNWFALGAVGLGLAIVAMLAVAAAIRRAPRLLTGGLAAVAGCLAIGLLVIAARALAGGSPVLGDQEAPVAAVLVVDTSPRMEYRQDNKTRLELAQETAQWLVRQLPADSEVAVVDSRSSGGAFAVDRAAATKMIERLRPTGTPRKLPDVLSAAIGLVTRSERPRKEVYVFTDLALAAWDDPSKGELQKLLAEHRNVLLYVIDVGAREPQNFALGDLQLSSEVLPQGSELALEVDVRAAGPGGTKTVQVQVEQPDPTLPIIRDGEPVLPKSLLRGSQAVKLEAGASERVRFVLRGLEPGVHQGLVRLVGKDGLAMDDVRYFAVEVQAAWPVLIVAPAGVSSTYLSEALAPRSLRETGQARFHCDTIDQSRLASQELADYRAVALVDPQPLTPDLWTKLTDYANRGGGVALFLGHNAQPLASFQQPAAVGMLGGKLTRQTRSAGGLFLAPRSYDHPITAAFRQIETNVPWSRFPIFFHWNLDELTDSARVLIPYGNNKPALVENRVGQGRVLTLTTAISDPPRPKGYEAWNRLATGEDAWPYLMLVNEMLLHLVGSGEMRLNLQAGETAVLPNDESLYPPRYQLFTPLEQPQDVSARDGRVTVRFTENPGAYRLRGQKDGPLVRGFAVNLAEQTSDLARLEADKLDELLGKGRYQLARNQDEIDRAVGNDRIGSEFYPLLATLVALVLGLEHVLANRFYKKDD
ncbi:MAG: BatA domain-containing protein [Pirellulaceae bacterium]